MITKYQTPRKPHLEIEMEEEDVSGIGVDICADNGGFYCKFLHATDRYCSKYEAKLFYEEPSLISALSFIKKCQKCLDEIKSDGVITPVV
jgi:hypothetical protein